MKKILTIIVLALFASSLNSQTYETGTMQILDSAGNKISVPLVVVNYPKKRLLNVAPESLTFNFDREYVPSKIINKSSSTFIMHEKNKGEK